MLPGGGVRHGEHPADAVVREFHEETGLRIVADRLREVVTDIEYLADVPAVRHHDRLIFDVTLLGGDLRDEPDGSSDRAAWLHPEEAAGLRLMPFAARAIGVPTTPLLDPELIPGLIADSRTAPVSNRHQRFASYGLVTDPTGRVLLTRISAGYPGAGRWHLPGGGTDFGESAADGLLRELVEETDQHGELIDLVSVSHRHQEEVVGPEGVAMDWHGVRVVFRARVAEPTTARVVDGGGSTDSAAWFAPAEALTLPLTEVARDAIVQHHSE
jgi:ADP-ribose pyrophosphatase YjhB (NUDIX family)